MPETASLLRLDIQRADDKALVICHGRLVAGVTDVLTAKVRPLISETRCIVLDLSDLTYMDSMGLGAVVRLYVSAKSAGCRLQLINIGARVRQVLGITNLLSVLTEMCEQGVSIRF